MLATLAILGCTIVTVVCAVVVVGAAITAGGLQIAAAQDAEDLQKDQMQMQEEANTKAEDRAKADKIIQKKMAEKNLLKARQSIGTSIAFTKLQAARKVKENARIRNDNGYSSSGTVPSATYTNGSPESA